MWKEIHPYTSPFYCSEARDAATKRAVELELKVIYAVEEWE